MEVTQSQIASPISGKGEIDAKVHKQLGQVEQAKEEITTMDQDNLRQPSVRLTRRLFSLSTSFGSLATPLPFYHIKPTSKHGTVLGPCRFCVEARETSRWSTFTLSTA